MWRGLEAAVGLGQKDNLGATFALDGCGRRPQAWSVQRRQGRRDAIAVYLQSEQIEYTSYRSGSEISPAHRP